MSEDPVPFTPSEAPEGRLLFADASVAHGWGALRLQLHTPRAGMQADVRLAFSWLGDAFSVLLDAALRLQRGEEVVVFSWESEPGEHLWVLRRAGALLDVRVMSDCVGIDPAAASEAAFPLYAEVLNVLVDVRDFTGAVVDLMRGIEQAYGRDGFEARWGLHDDYRFDWDRLARLAEGLERP
jgi:hypothetical protein